RVLLILEEIDPARECVHNKPDSGGVLHGGFCPECSAAHPLSYFAFQIRRRFVAKRGVEVAGHNDWGFAAANVGENLLHLFLTPLGFAVILQMHRRYGEFPFGQFGHIELDRKQSASAASNLVLDLFQKDLIACGSLPFFNLGYALLLLVVPIMSLQKRLEFRLFDRVTREHGGAVKRAQASLVYGYLSAQFVAVFGFGLFKLFGSETDRIDLDEFDSIGPIHSQRLSQFAY